MNPILGNYILQEKIADGGMGEVFRAVKKGILGFEKPVVLKKILPFYCDNPDFIRMLTQEALISSYLSHPNIVHTIDFIDIEGSYCLVMEYVSGVDLGKIIAKSKQKNVRLDPYLSLFIISKALKGLLYAHNYSENGRRLKILHRDISPQNILVSFEGIVKLADFGIASSTLNEVKTKNGEIKGKVNYMSPEQIKGENLDERSDIFSVSAVLYELIFGIKPFEGISEYETMKNIVDSDNDPDFRQINLDDPRIIRLIKKGLSKNREQTYKNSTEFLDEVLNIISKGLLKDGDGKIKDLLINLFPKEELVYNPLEKTPLLRPEFVKQTEKSMIFGNNAITPKNKSYITYFIFGAVVVLTSVSSYIYFQKRARQSDPTVKTELKTSRIPESAAKSLDTINSASKEDDKRIQKRFGTLSINSHPWSRIYLNGKELGETPIKGLELESGEYIINMVFLTGDRIIKKIKIKRGKPTQIFEKLPNK